MPIATPSPTQTATITVNGSTYTTWQSVMVQRELNNGTSIFEFEAAEGAYGPNFTNLKIYTGDDVTITLDGQLALTGKVAIRKVTFDDKSHTCTIMGRGLTAKATETTVKQQQGSFNGFSFSQVANKLLGEIGVQLKIQNDNGDATSMKFPFNAAHPGETISQHVSRLAESLNLFISDHVDGSVVAHRFDPSAAPVGTFVQGQNILRASVTEDNSFMSGTIQGISQMPNLSDGKPTRAQSASVKQGGGDQQSASLFVAEMPLPADILKLRTQHENVANTWQVFTCEVTVFGWTTDTGTLWDPVANHLVTVVSDMIFPDPPYSMELAVRGVTFHQDNGGGSTSTLDLTLPRMLSPAGALADAAAPGGQGNGETGAVGKADNVKAIIDPPDDQSNGTTSA